VSGGGPVALLQALVARGLAADALVPAASLIVALDEGADGLRTCACGCGARFRPARRDRPLATPSWKRPMLPLAFVV
jgi:hypothetical protein